MKEVIRFLKNIGLREDVRNRRVVDRVTLIIKTINMSVVMKISEDDNDDGWCRRW